MQKKFFWRSRSKFLLLFVGLFSGLCAAGSAVTKAESDPLGTSGAMSVDMDGNDVREPAGDITLGQALALALLRNPELAAFSWEVRAADARALQAGLRPNPELEFEIEEFGGTGDKSGAGSAVTTLGVVLPIELGGKRAGRKRVTLLEKSAAEWDYESKRLDVLAETTRSFIAVLAAQERYALAQELYHLSEKVLETVSERVTAGKVSPLEETRAGVALSTSRIEMERAGRELQAAQKRLASNWGSAAPSFAKAIGDFYGIGDVEAFDELKTKIVMNPDIATWDQAMELRRAIVDLEKAAGTPDMSVGLSSQWFNESGERALALQFAITLPVYDRNQGGTLAARREHDKAVEERGAAEIRVLTELNEAWQALNAAHLEAVTLSKEVLPSAQWAFDAAQEGYRYGKFGYLDVLDAQRSLYEVKGQYIEALASYHSNQAVVNRLIGRRDGLFLEATGARENGGER